MTKDSARLSPEPAPDSAANTDEATPKTSGVSGGYIPSLDGMRAVAFLTVFIAHCGYPFKVPGGFGVTVFFFLSGYLITTLLRRELETAGRIDLSRFYARRALRILPPFYLVLLGSAALHAFVGPPPSFGPMRWEPIFAQAAHIANWWQIVRGQAGTVAGTGVYWSLAVEEHFYLLFPLLLTVLWRWELRGRALAGALWSICCLILIWRGLLILSGSVEDRTYMGSDTRFDSLLFGCALAVWNNPVVDTIQPPTEKRWIYLYAPLALLGLAVTFAVQSFAFREGIRYTIQGICLTPIFFAVIRRPKSVFGVVLNARPMRALGSLSYSLYLVHHCVLFSVSALRPHASIASNSAITLIITIVLSTLIYIAMERPLARLRKKLHARGAKAFVVGIVKR